MDIGPGETNWNAAGLCPGMDVGVNVGKGVGLRVGSGIMVGVSVGMDATYVAVAESPTARAVRAMTVGR
ncbi:MAG: hypothetical protein C3F07_08735 [Anaerolineales bacterium]|nr:MAG: hypothetical protein C3F07_08735 [Anaerolineales bacterium]